MVRTHKEVSKRAKNSITIQIGKLVKKYGEKSVRLVAMKIFKKMSDKSHLESEIQEAEIKLRKLKSKN